MWALTADFYDLHQHSPLAPGFLKDSASGRHSKTGGWKKREAGVFIPPPHAQSKQALLGYRWAVAELFYLRLQLLLGNSLLQLQLLHVPSISPSYVPPGLGEGSHSG